MLIQITNIAKRHNVKPNVIHAFFKLKKIKPRQTSGFIVPDDAMDGFIEYMDNYKKKALLTYIKNGKKVGNSKKGGRPCKKK